jgi:hypothetical protein
VIESTAKFRARDQAALHLKVARGRSCYPRRAWCRRPPGRRQVIPELANEAFERAAAGTMADLTVIAGDRQ